MKDAANVTDNNNNNKFFIFLWWLCHIQRWFSKGHQKGHQPLMFENRSGYNLISVLFTWEFMTEKWQYVSNIYDKWTECKYMSWICS